MSDMAGNPHYWNLSRGYTTQDRADADTCQIEATLALAYEQRTANLIAYHTLWNSAEGSRPTKQRDDELAQRLGINDE